MIRRLVLPGLVLVLVVVPTVAAAPPAASPKNAAQWCKAWRAGGETARFAVVYPGNLGFAKTFESKRGNGLAKTNLFGRCVSLTAMKLAAAPAAAAAESSVTSRCKAELARAGSAYQSVGRCVSDRGRQIRP